MPHRHGDFSRGRSAKKPIKLVRRPVNRTSNRVNHKITQTELAEEIREHALDPRAPKQSRSGPVQWINRQLSTGPNKSDTVLRVLIQMHKAGEIVLPEPQNRGGKNAQRKK
ncbi:MAG: hypothetical protein JW772_01400 [Candidatus Diapherotrites archaeon]|nr:hypothetical protein [Candidatus Diapherotrites archaeon]